MNLLNPPHAITLSPLEQMIADDEGFSAQLYRCPAGHLTIGYGTNIDAGWDESLALVVMRYQLGRIDAALLRRLPWYGRLNARRRGALLSMAYQLGVDGLLGFSRMLAACAAGNWPAAHDHALDSKWARKDAPARALRIANLLLDPEGDP